MGRSPCCDESTVLKKGAWTQEEDEKLKNHIRKHGHGSWRALPKLAGLNRCGKSCRLRWINYLRPDIKRGNFTLEEEQTIINLHSLLGNKWSSIAGHLPGRTDNEIKNYWNTHIRKKLLQMGIDPMTHRPRTDHLNVLASLPQLLLAHAANFNNLLNLNQLDATSLAKADQLLHSMIQVLNNNNNNTSSLGFDHEINDSSLFGQSNQNVYDQTQIIENHHDQPLDSFSNQNLIPPLIKNKYSDHTSNPSSTSTFTQDHNQTWSDIIDDDDQASDSYWKEIIEQSCSETWPFGE